MTVMVYKMINGEEIIGELLKEDASSVTLKDAAQIILQRDEKTGGVGVALAPTMPYADGNIKFIKTAMMAVVTPTQSLVNEYNRVFGSGIQIAPASTLAGLQVAK